MFSLYFTALRSSAVKETNRYLRIWVQALIPPVITTSLYFVIFGKMTGRRTSDMGDLSYMEFIVLGLIMMSAITSLYVNVSPSFFSQESQKNIEEVLVASVLTRVIIWGFVIRDVSRNTLAGTLVTITSLFFVLLHVVSWLMIITALSMIVVLFSLAGLLNGVFVQSYDDISIVSAFVLQPLAYLDGVFYVISILPPSRQAVPKVSPIVYMISRFRYGLLGAQDVPIGIPVTILTLFIVALYGICWHSVETGRGLRS